MNQTSRPPALLAISMGLAGAALGAQAPIGIIISEQSRTAFTIQGAGARATGLGGAFIAVADDATAASFNPAGLAQLLKPEISFVGRGSRQDIAFKDVETIRGARTLVVSDSLITNSHFDPLFISATMPLRVGEKTLALQFSAQRLIPLDKDDARDLTESPASGGGSSLLRQAIRQDGQIDLYTFSMAYELSERVLVGIAANQWRGRWGLDSRSSKTSGGTTSFVNFAQSNDLDGTNFNLGLLWRWPTWSLGLVRRTGFRAEYSFDTTLIQTSSNGGPVMTRTPRDQRIGLHWPSSTGIGLAIRPSERWLVTADLTHTAWSDARYMASQRRLDGQNFFDLDKGTRTPNATDFHFGVERIFLTESGTVMPLRMGYSREPQPVVDRITGEQRVIQAISLGTGLKRGSYTLDVAYRYGWGTRQASQFLDVDQILSNIRPTSVGTERIRDQRLDLTFIVQFEREPVQAFLHHLFVGD